MGVNDNITVEAGVSIGDNVQIWDNSKIREGARIGANVIIGQGVYVGPGVQIGNNCKIQNLAQIYEPAVIEDNCFIGPGAILTNDLNPRATTDEGLLKKENDWEKSFVTIKFGASVGAGVICIAPVTIGSFSLIGSGAVITKDVPPHALVIGNPGRVVSWVGSNGKKLIQVDGYFIEKDSGSQYCYIDKRNPSSGLRKV